MKRSLTIAFLATLLAACGGGGGGGAPAPAPGPAPAPAPGPSADTTPPTITAYSPGSATAVARSTEISATFSEALEADTVIDANLGMTRAGTAVPGTLTYNATSDKITFTPQQPLDLLASYTVTAGTGLRDAAGNSLAASQSWSFQTADGTWQGAGLLDGANAVAGTSDIATDPSGNVVAVWSAQASSGWYVIRSATYSTASGWSSAANVSTPGNIEAYLPQFRLDAQGNGLAVWTQTGSTGASNPSVWAARYVKGQGWQAAVQIDQDLANTQAVSLAVDAAGDAVAVWAKPIGANAVGNPDIWAAHFTPAGGWEAAVRVGSSANIGTYDKADQPQVVMDDAGNANVLWIQDQSAAPVWFAQYRAGAGWQPAVSLGATAYGDPYAPRLALSASGQLMAVWNTSIYNGGPYRFDLWWSTLENGAWSTPALLEDDTVNDARGQVVAADSSGNFHVLWQQFASSYSSGIVHRQYTPGTGWSAPETISSASGSYDQNRLPALVADRNGNLMATWNVYGSGYGGAEEGMFARRYIAGSGWQPETRLANVGGGGLFENSAMAVAADGSIAATWVQAVQYQANGPVWADLFR